MKALKVSLDGVKEHYWKLETMPVESNRYISRPFQGQFPLKFHGVSLRPTLRSTLLALARQLLQVLLWIQLLGTIADLHCRQCQQLLVSLRLSSQQAGQLGIDYVMEIIQIRGVLCISY